MPEESANIEEKAVHSGYAQNSGILFSPNVIPSVTGFNQSQASACKTPDLASMKAVFPSQQLSASTISK